jgi:hypothetical protein
MSRKLEIDKNSCRRSDRTSSQARSEYMFGQESGSKEERETTEVEQMPITECKQPNGDVTGDGRGCDRKVRSR